MILLFCILQTFKVLLSKNKFVKYKNMMAIVSVWWLPVLDGLAVWVYRAGEQDHRQGARHGTKPHEGPHGYTHGLPW